MSSARLCITVPEALWRRACPDGDSPSKVVQEALRLMVDAKFEATNASIREYYEEAIYSGYYEEAMS